MTLIYSDLVRWLLSYWPLKISLNEVSLFQYEYFITIFALMQIVYNGSHTFLFPHSQDIYVGQSPVNGAGSQQTHLITSLPSSK